jgi:LysM repeat protein
MKKNIGIRLASVLAFGAILISACQQSYSQAPLATPTLIPTGLFVSPFPAGQDPMQIVADLGTQTAIAKTAEAGGTPGTPGTPTATLPAGTFITPVTSPSITPALGTVSPVVVLTTPAPVTVIPGGSSVTPQTTVVVPTIPAGRPATYTLQKGEWPFCIARRYDLNPDDLLTLNGIIDGGIFMPGLVLKIPQTGSFPVGRALNPHPDTYTVESSDETIYGVACYYGDVFPEAIARANNLPLAATLNVGQRLSIP